MIIDYLLSNFEILVFTSVCLLVMGFLLLFFFQNQSHKQQKEVIFKYVNDLNKFNKEIKEYLIVIGNLLDQQKKEMAKISEKIIFIEREINRLSEIKGSEDVLTQAIDMAREGSTRDEIINKTGLREDEVEAIYTYYRK
jgi:cell division protein FtsB